jgi:hypothetical protein
MQPDLEGAGLLRAFGISSCCYTAHRSLGMTLIRASTLAFGLIGKQNYKILLWDYEFGI